MEDPRFLRNVIETAHTQTMKIMKASEVTSQDVSVTISSKASVPPYFHTDWNARYRFASEISYPINDISCSVLPLQYEKVIEIDQRIRDFKFPPHLQEYPFSATAQTDVFLLTMQRFMAAGFIELSEYDVFVVNIPPSSPSLW